MEHIGQEPVISGDFADDFPVNILREKTFNPDLKNLLDKIEANEQIDLPADQTDECDDIPDDRLLMKLHQLFYMVKNLDNTHEINYSFDPYAFNHPDTNLHDKILEYIKNSLGKNCFMLHSILTFSNFHKCYVRAVTGGGKEGYLIINPRDKFYHDIKMSSYGYLLNRHDIEENSFLAKNFTDFLRSKDARSLYFIEMNRITSVLYKEISNINDYPALNDLLPPVIIIEIHNDSSEKEIFDFLCEKLPVHFFILKENSALNLESRNFETFSDLLSTAENFLILHQNLSGFSALIISSRENINYNSLYKMRYIYSRLMRILPGNSIVMRISNNKIIVLSDTIFISLIKQMIDDYNSIDDNSYTIVNIPKTDNNNFNENLKMICL